MSSALLSDLQNRTRHPLFSANGFRDLAQAVLPQTADQEGGVSGQDQAPIKDLAWHEGEVLQLKDAAVLIGVVDRGEDATILLTQRTNHLPSHAGQIAFPGGKVDEGDSSVISTALRETDEETGISEEFIEPFGQLRPYISSTGYRIFPVLSVVRPGFTPRPNPGEVSDIFEVPLHFLMDPANHLQKSAEWRGKMRGYFAMPYEQYYIWGVTAGILRNLYETVYRL
ncbi:MAG: CoA pyrophosphatase [Cohaesibacter sp.]|nr:CoA pyrophosphatase [Cohaesibacter sp.]